MSTKLSQLTAKLRTNLEQTKWSAQAILLKYTVDELAKDSNTKTRLGLIISLANDGIEELDKLEAREHIYHGNH